MKRIFKNLPNKPLEQWRKKQKPEHLNFENLRDPERELVLEWLIKEQGALCCYTGIRIDADTSHIEHLKPQTICRKEGTQEDIAADNILAAFPKSASCPYGAKYRGHWYGEDDQKKPAHLFVHPLMPDCESRFRYNWTGDVEATKPQDAAARMTIERLGLGNGELEDRRRSAVKAIFFQKAKPLSSPKIQRIVANLDKRDKAGAFRAFCFVLKQAGEQLLKAADREHKRRVAIQRTKKK